MNNKVLPADLLEWLQQFYLKHCNGDWEHSFEFKISNIDNPGWMIKFDLADTKLSTATFNSVNEQRADADWIICRKTDDVFLGYGGPLNLVELLSIFKGWASEYGDIDGSIWLQ